jgi:hypothetical protein
MSFGFGFGFPKRAGGGVAFPLDGLTASLGFAYSARQLLTSYTGPLMRIRVENAGTGGAANNAEYNVAPVGTSGITSASVCTLALGSGPSPTTIATLLADSTAGSRLFVKTLYDQSGGGLDLTQGTTTRQPQITSAAGTLNTFGGSGRVCMVNAGGTGLERAAFPATSLTGATNNATYIYVTSGPNGICRTLDWPAGTGIGVVRLEDISNGNISFTVGQFFGGFGTISFTPGNNPDRQGVAMRNGVNGALYRNGSPLNSLSTMETTNVPAGTSTLVLGNDSTYGFGQVGNLAEIVGYTNDSVSYAASFITAQRTFWGL